MSITRRLVLTGLVALVAMLGIVAAAGPAAAQNVTPTSAAGVTPPAAGGVEGVAPPSSASDNSDPTIAVDVGGHRGERHQGRGRTLQVPGLIALHQERLRAVCGDIDEARTDRVGGMAERGRRAFDLEGARSRPVGARKDLEQVVLALALKRDDAQHLTPVQLEGRITQAAA